MKKITFILFALITGTTFAQGSADALGDASAGIVTSLAIVKGDALNFGNIVSAALGDNVVITTNGAGGTRDLGTLTATDGVFSEATFTVTAAENVSYQVTLPDGDLITLTGPNGTMDVHTFTILGGIDKVASSGDDVLYVGATLTVKDAQADGLYTGQVPVTVTYQ